MCPAGMEAGMLLGESPCLDRSVDLGGTDIGMAKHLLDRSEVGPAFKQMGGK